MRRTPRLALLALALVATGDVAARAEGEATRPAAEDPTFVGEVVVREVDVRFDRSILPPLESLGRRGEEDFVYYEDGRPCPTLRFEPEGDAKDWRLLVWLDPQLAGGESLQLATRELAGRAAALAAAGSVEIVVASEPAPKRLGEFKGAGAIAEALTGAVASLPRGPERVAPERAAARVDRLVATLEALPQAGPSAILLPASGWVVDEATFAHLSAARRGEPAPAWAEALAGGARALAADGWVPIVIGVTAAQAETPRVTGAPEVTLGPSGDTRVNYPVLTLPGRGGAKPDRIDTALDLSLAPLSDLARPGSGTLVGSGAHLAATLARLLRRSRLVARAPEPAAGASVLREVRWIGGDGRPLPTPTVASGGPPRELAAARLRLRVAGDRDSGELSALRIDGREPLRLCLAEGATTATVRFSRAEEGPEGARIRFGAPIRLDAASGESCAEEDLEPGSEPAAARLVEDLERSEWLLL